MSSYFIYKRKDLNMCEKWQEFGRTMINHVFVSIPTGMAGTNFGAIIGTFLWPGTGTLILGCIGAFFGGLSGGLITRNTNWLKSKLLKISKINLDRNGAANFKLSNILGKSKYAMIVAYINDNVFFYSNTV